MQGLNWHWLIQLLHAVVLQYIGLHVACGWEGGPLCLISVGYAFPELQNQSCWPQEWRGKNCVLTCNTASWCYRCEWLQCGGHVHLDAKGAPVCAGVPGDSDAQYAGWLHGQSSEVHWQGTYADRETEEYVYSTRLAEVPESIGLSLADFSTCLFMIIVTVLPVV